MFNTFNGDHQELAFAKKQKTLMKQRLIQLNNFSTIQLNPWNDDHTKSPLYEEHQGFPNFPKPNIKNSALIKYSVPRQQAKKHQNKIIIDRKRIDPKNLAKRQSHLIRGRKKFICEDSELQKMNKTISVNNFEGQKMFSQNESIQRRQKVLERQEKRHRTTINNPMYGRFCINYNDKQNPPQRKKILSDAVCVKFDNVSMSEIMKFRSKMSTLSMDRADPERAKSIHEVRRRLKSTSQIMKRKDQNLQIGAHEITQRADQQLFSQKPQKQKSKQRIEYVNLAHVKNVSSLIEGERLESCESGEKFKLGRRKNLYIGFRKFFNQNLNSKQKPIQRKQSLSRQIVNLDALMEQGQGEVIRKFQKFQEYAFQKSFNRNTN